MDQPRNAALAVRLGVVVVAVQYRLAPAHACPAAVDDVVAAFRWCVDHADDLGVDAGRIALHGTSAGGGLCVAVALRLREAGALSPAFLWLDAP